MAIKYRTGGAASLSPIKLIKIQCEANMFVVHIREIVFFLGFAASAKRLNSPVPCFSLMLVGKFLRSTQKN